MLRAGIRHPLGLTLLLASVLLGGAMALLPALAPWSGRALWVLALGLLAYCATVAVVALPSRRPEALRDDGGSEALAERPVGPGETPDPTPPRAALEDRAASEAPEERRPEPQETPAPPARQPTPKGRTYPGGLTAREVEVLRRLARGMTNKEIASALVLSNATVERHIANIYGKIGARGRAEATAYALRHVLIDRDAP